MDDEKHEKIIIFNYCYFNVINCSSCLCKYRNCQRYTWRLHPGFLVNEEKGDYAVLVKAGTEAEEIINRANLYFTNLWFADLRIGGF